jgi:hypothetical protein
MRGAWIVAAALLATALSPQAARAGVYFTTGTFTAEFSRPDDPDAQEPWPLASASFSQFHQDLAAYRAAAVEPKDQKPSPIHLRYKRRVQELEGKESRGILSVDGRINLGAYYIRLQQPQKAIRLLEPVARQSRHFMLLANLATAYEMAGGMNERAIDYRQQALAAWPAMYPGWDTAQVRFYRKAEQYHLLLLTLRDEEARQQAGRTRLQLDRLFPRVQFVGPSGHYEAGTIAPAQWAEVPFDANLLVMQLLLWMPFDDRLHWLMGELLNASGNVSGAAAMMKEIVNRQQDPSKWDAAAPPELREHYRIVSAEAAAREQFVPVQLNLERNDFYVFDMLRAALAPRGMGLGAGDLIQEASWPAMIIHTEEQRRRAEEQKRKGQATPEPERTTAALSPSTTQSWVPNWRQLGVGFGAGVLVTLLLSMQMRQLGKTKG